MHSTLEAAALLSSASPDCRIAKPLPDCKFGFVSRDSARAYQASGQSWLRGLLALGYPYGFRRGELLGNPKKGTEATRCGQVDLLNNTVTLYSGEAKNGEGRTVALTEECRQPVTELRKGKRPRIFSLRGRTENNPPSPLL
jgi:hypothetical protein